MLPRDPSLHPARRPLAAALAAAALGAPAGAHAAAHASSGGATWDGSPAEVAAPPPVAGGRAKLRSGAATAPAMAPRAVKLVIRAANAIRRRPYRYGGGHGSFLDTAYDCSGAVSYALHGGRLLDAPLDSSSLMTWGRRGRGRWITVYTNPGHAYVVVAGLRFDTSAVGEPGVRESGPRWRRTTRPPGGFTARHPPGL